MKWSGRLERSFGLNTHHCPAFTCLYISVAEICQILRKLLSYEKGKLVSMGIHLMHHDGSADCIQVTSLTVIRDCLCTWHYKGLDAFSENWNRREYKLDGPRGSCWPITSQKHWIWGPSPQITSHGRHQEQNYWTQQKDEKYGKCIDKSGTENRNKKGEEFWN